MPETELYVECVCVFTSVGETVCIVGNCEELGNWDAQKAIPLYTESNSFPRWKMKENIRLYSVDRFEFKFIITSNNHSIIRWENFVSNRFFCLPREPCMISITCSFDNPDMSFFKKSLVDVCTLERYPVVCAPSQTVGAHMRRRLSVSKLYSNSIEDAPKDDWFEYFVNASKLAKSWRQKLENIQSLLKTIDKNSAVSNPTESSDKLIVTGLYLRFLQTQKIQCLEDGQHNRPNVIADISKALYCTLESIMAVFEGRSLLSPEHSIDMGMVETACRSIFPFLPSFVEAFACSQPLTRIRDIAHRNDIPPCLKQEIKHTLQNKLHRCAAPQDLEVCKKLLNRLEQESHPQEFMNQFRIFYRELQEFFTGQSLMDGLIKLEANSDPQTASLIQNFIKMKDIGDSAKSDQLRFLCLAISSGTVLRCHLVHSLLQVSFERLFEKKTKGIEFHHLRRVCEIKLEKILFVFLSQVSALIESETQKWSDPIEALHQGIVNMVSTAPCHKWLNIGSLLTELEEAQRLKYDADSPRKNCLILQSILDRISYLYETSTELILRMYSNWPGRLARAFNLENLEPDNIIAEAEIRASISYPISGICTILKKRLRTILGQGPLETVVRGKCEAIGLLVVQNRLNLSELKHQKSSIILFLENCDGDEEVTGIFEMFNVVGLVIAHPIGHLSHLSIRVREENVILICCSDPNYANEISGMANQLVRLNASADDKMTNITICTKNGDIDLWSAKKPRSFRRDPASETESLQSYIYPKLASHFLILPDNEFDLNNVGMKAFSCKSLFLLSQENVKSRNHSAYFRIVQKLLHNSGSSRVYSEVSAFDTPRSFAVPFGVLNFLLKRQNLYQEFSSLRDQLQKSIDSDSLIDTSTKIGNIISQIRLTREDVAPYLNQLSGVSDQFILRSSASVEDLGGRVSAAGLYDSVLNIDPSNIEEFTAAACTVWSSLYSSRAILSRSYTLLPETMTEMAILLQPLIAPNYCFVVHTTNPINNSPDEVYIEVAHGLGETLASGVSFGSPYRCCLNKKDGAIEELSFPSFLYSLQPSMLRRRSVSFLGNRSEETSLPSPKIMKVPIDYSKDPLMTDEAFRHILAIRILAVSMAVEEKMNIGPLDIEGCLTKQDTLWIVQARKQAVLQ